jgi:transglutaminase-like putative cysteine protease
VRLFYDLYSTRGRTEALLIGADCAVVSIAVLLATAALHGGGSAWDIALLPLWASIPRAIARILVGFDRPRAGYRAALAMASLIVLMTVLAVLGHGLISSVAPDEVLRKPFLLAVLFLGWGSGVLLCHPGAYRLHDVLLFSTVLLALKESRPLPWVFVPLFLGAFFLSSSVRHLLHDVFPGRREPPWNLQNARAASFVAAVAASVVFVVAGLALGAVIPAAPAAPAARRARLDAGARGTDRGHAEGPFIIEELVDPRGSAGASRIGFSYRVGLRELAYARLDAREVLRVAPDPEDPRARGWRPQASMLWKGITLSSYDPESESWIEESRLTRMGWPAGGAVLLPGGLPADAPRILIRATITTPVLRSALQPYVTHRILSREFTGYSMNPMGDLFPHPPIAKGTSYRLEISVEGRTAEAPALAGAQDVNADARWLAVPPAATLGIDLRAAARSIFRGERSVPACIAALRSHFERNGFRYSNRAAWRGKEPLARFLGEERVGSCAYFATAAALLLRAGGVHARLAAGFLGGEWNQDRGHAVIRSHDAHAWVEVRLPGAGWMPIDPTAWVPADPSYKPPVEAPASVAGSADAGAARRDREWTGGALETFPEGGEAPPALTDEAVPWTTDGSRVVLSSGKDGELGPEDLEVAAALESWIEYPEEAAGETADLVSGAGAAGGAGEGSREDRPWVHAPSALRAPEPLTPVPRPAGLGAGLRAALVLAGGVVLSLVVFTFLRPRRKEEDEEADEEDGTDWIEEGGAAAAEPIFLDDADPRDRVLADYLRLQASLERTRSHRRPHQTPVEHGQLMARGRRALEAAFRDLHAILYRLIYGGEAIDERQAAAARKSCRRIRRYLG